MAFSKNRVLTFKHGCMYLGYAKSYVYKITTSNILPYSRLNGKTIYFEGGKLENCMLSNASISYEERQVKAATFVNSKK